ncbi:MAG: hypothetical protein ACXWP1_09930, partial [Bdellovibrionota bacterium]
MKFLSALSLLLIQSAPAHASATDLDAYLREQLFRIDNGVRAQERQAPPAVPLSHIFLTLRADLGIGITDIAGVAVQPELIFVWAQE